MEHGRFITLEGGDGAGKSTQARLLAEHLKKNGRKVVLTREVGGSPGAEAIRRLWLSPDDGHWDAVTELLLIFAARRDHLVNTIWPAMERGEWIVCDRFIDSTRAYQGAAMGMGQEIIDQLYRAVANDFLPNLTFVLDVPTEIGVERMKGRELDRYEKKDADFHKKLRETFHNLAMAAPDRMKMIDASRSAEEIAKEIALLTDKHFHAEI